MSNKSIGHLTKEQNSLCCDIYKQYVGLILKVSRDLLSDKSNSYEILQQVMGISVPEAILKGRLPEFGTNHLKYWICKVTKNQTLKWQEKWNKGGLTKSPPEFRITVTDDSSCFEDVSNVTPEDEQIAKADNLEEEKIMSVLYDEIECLNFREKTIINAMLNGLEKDEIREIARQIKLPEEQIPVYYSRGVKKLRAHINKVYPRSSFDKSMIA